MSNKNEQPVELAQLENRLKDAMQNCRHRNHAETEYWYNQWKLLASDAMKLLRMCPMREIVDLQAAADRMERAVSAEEWDFKDYEYAAMACAEAWGLKHTPLTDVEGGHS